MASRVGIRDDATSADLCGLDICKHKMTTLWKETSKERSKETRRMAAEDFVLAKPPMGACDLTRKKGTS